MRVLVATALLAASITAALAGCGGGDSGSDLRAAAEDRCDQALASIREVGPLAATRPHVEADRELAIAAELDAMRNDVAELDGPDDLHREVDDYLDGVAEQQRGLEEAGELTAPRSRVAANLRSVDNGAEREAAKLGLDSCRRLEAALLVQIDGAPRGS